MDYILFDCNLFYKGCISLNLETLVYSQKINLLLLYVCTIYKTNAVNRL